MTDGRGRVTATGTAWEGRKRASRPSSSSYGGQEPGFRRPTGVPSTSSSSPPLYFHRGGRVRDSNWLCARPIRAVSRLIYNIRRVFDDSRCRRACIYMYIGEGRREPSQSLSLPRNNDPCRFWKRPKARVTQSVFDRFITGPGEPINGCASRDAVKPAAAVVVVVVLGRGGEESHRHLYRLRAVTPTQRVQLLRG